MPKAQIQIEPNIENLVAVLRILAKHANAAADELSELFDKPAQDGDVE